MDDFSATASNMALSQSILDAIPYAAYVVNTQTYTIVADNLATKRRYGPANIGQHCYACYRDRSEPCEACPIGLHNSTQRVLSNFIPFFNSKSQSWHKFTVSFHETGGGQSLAILVVIPTDEHPLRQERVEDFGYIDSCTNVANNCKYEEEGRALLAHCMETQQSAIVVAFKVEGLHRINSVQGYAKGDKVLRALVQDIGTVLPANSLMARQRGNDFSILCVCPQQHAHAELAILKNRLELAVRNSCASDGNNWLKVRMGASLSPDHAQSFELLNRKAFQAMALGNNSLQCFVFNTYDDGIMRSLRDKEELLLDLTSATQRGEMQLLFQPKHQISSARIVGAEALVRWHHPERGVVAPDIFIPLAEQNLTVPTIDNWVIAEVCRLWRRFPHAMPPMLPVSINISPQRFYQADFIDTVMKALKMHNLPPTMLEIELTERTALQDIDTAVKIMHVLRMNGVRVAIDDFGTEYSSLNYLRVLPFDTVKLDRSFIIDGGEKTPAILKGIVTLVKVYNADVVCEGVETAEQYALARQVECDFIQGYYTGRPMPIETFEALLQQQDG